MSYMSIKTEGCYFSAHVLRTNIFNDVYTCVWVVCSAKKKVSGEICFSSAKELTLLLLVVLHEMKRSNKTVVNHARQINWKYVCTYVVGYKLQFNILSLIICLSSFVLCTCIRFFIYINIKSQREEIYFCDRCYKKCTLHKREKHSIILKFLRNPVYDDKMKEGKLRF